jgi:hypothetical protein
MWLIVTVVLAVLSLRGSLGAYVAYMLFAILLIPARAGFQIQPLVLRNPGVGVERALLTAELAAHPPQRTRGLDDTGTVS